MGGPSKLLVDAMLGSLARKLRIFGCDTAYFRDGSDSDLLALARAQGRLVLTSDRALVSRARKVGVPALLIEGRTDRSRLASLEVGAREGSFEVARGASRCASCNTPLLSLKPVEVEAELTSSVARRHRVYYRCPDCEKLYWRGSHWKRLRRLSSIMPRA